MKKTYYLYHIPGKKIGVTCNLKNRVEKIQGYSKGEYNVLYETDDIDDISEKEIEYQKKLGYKVDQTLYKNLKIKSNKIKMKINSTEQTSTFPVPLSGLKDYLELHKGLSWTTTLGEFKLTEEAIRWMCNNAHKSQFTEDRCYIYNKAFYEAFISEGLLDTTEQLKAPTMRDIFPLIRQWADERGIYDKGDEKTQYIKLMEEAGELAQALLKQNKAEATDAIGDMVVVLTNLAVFIGADIEDCITDAYNVIKNRKGKMDNGTFVKEL